MHPSRSARRQANSEVQGSQEEDRHSAAEGEVEAIDAVEEASGQAEGDTDFRSPDAGVPRVSLDYFFLGDYETLKTSKSAATMTNKHLHGLVGNRCVKVIDAHLRHNGDTG